MRKATEILPWSQHLPQPHLLLKSANLSPSFSGQQASSSPLTIRACSSACGLVAEASIKSVLCGSDYQSASPILINVARKACRADLQGREANEMNIWCFDE
jgi:hypothetical protein